MRISNTTSRANLHHLMGALAILVLCASASLAQYAGGPAKLTIKSTVLGEERTILVRTPQGYDTNKTAYPVLYITDGDAHIGHTSSTIEFLARNGRMSDMIVVGITNTDRTRDLTPTKATGPNSAQFPTAGGADNFLKFIETEVIPEIEKSYRVRPYRVLAGHSFGGLFVLHALITRPELFNSYIAVSPSLQWSDEATLRRAEEFTGAVAGGLKAADEHYKWLSQKFGYSISTPEGLVNLIGYQYLQGGTPDEAIATFKANVERYPNSANVYDSLAEAYEKGGRLELATPLYEKAKTLGQQNHDPNAALFAANFARASEKMKQAEAAKQGGTTKPPEGSKQAQTPKKDQ